MSHKNPVCFHPQRHFSCLIPNTLLQIDLKLREGGLYCTDDKLIIVGGYSEGIDGKLGDAGVYEVRLSDFSRTELHLINRE